MRLMITAAVAAFALVFAGASADAKAAKSNSHSFNISCPALSPKPISMGSCTATGKSKEAARKACQVKHNFCYIQDQKAAKKAAKKGKKAKKKAKK